MTSYSQYARDLRTLAGLLDTLEPDLPLPRFADQGLTISIHVPEANDVVQAAKALDVAYRLTGGGHTTAVADIDSVHIEYVHVPDDQMPTTYRGSHRGAL